MITEKTIRKACVYLRKNNTIPDETIVFMRNAALEKLNKIIEENAYSLRKDMEKIRNH